MHKKQLGKSDLYVSSIGLGCMSLGTEKEKAGSIIDRALDLGINYLDTADLYDYGRNEEIVGEAIKTRRHDLILATKVGNRWSDKKDGWSWDPSKAYIKEEVKESLRRLQTDYIDLYQLHGGTIEDNIDETIEAFEELTNEGVIRHYGISSIRPNVIREYVQKSSIISVMMQYSMLDRRPEETVLAFLNENNISVIARGPLAQGLLTEKGISVLEKKAAKSGYLGYSTEELKSLISDLQTFRPGYTLTETAIQYCLYPEVVASVIVGASRIEQLEENVKAASSLPLSSKEVEQIQQLTKPNKYEAHR